MKAWSVIADAQSIYPSLTNRVIVFGRRGKTATRRAFRDAPKVGAFMAPSARNPREALYVLCLDARYGLLGFFIASLGGPSSAPFDPSSLPALQVALALESASIVIVHNHPSGDPSPSAEDVALTERIVKSAAEVDMPVSDHVIVGTEGFFSFRESGLLPAISSGKLGAARRPR